MSETAGEPAAVPPPTPGRAAGERDLARITRQAFFDARDQAMDTGYDPARYEELYLGWWLAAAQAAIAAAPACPCGGMPGRVKLLEKLFDTWWNRVGTLESDSPGYSLISYDDIQAMEDICLAIERMDGQP